METRGERAGRPGVVAAVLLPVFFASGFAALVYQTVWQRVLTLFCGADVYSVTLIVAAFMAGLGFGSLAGGALADRLGPRGRCLAFALAESGVALFAWGSLPLFYDVLYRRLGQHELSLAASGLLLFALLLVPTFLMGLSLPLLARLVEPRERQPERWIGQLYGANTLGAALGSLASVWWLVRAWGFAGTVHAAAGLNLACAGAAVLLASRAPRASGPTAPVPLSSPETGGPEAFGFGAWVALYAVTGFVALSLEIVWFRLLGVVLKSNAFTFATLLAVYLVGVGGGALLGSRLARRVSRPGTAFLALQALIPASAALTLAAFVGGLASGHAPTLLREYVSQYEMLDLAGTLAAASAWLAGRGLEAEGAALLRLFAQLYGLVPLLLFGPATLLMGLTFPLLQKATQTDPQVVGRRVGLLQAANILGCTLGTVLTGLVLLARLGSAGTLRALVALGGALLVPLLARRDGRRAALAVLPLVAAAAWACPSPAQLWSALHGARPHELLFGEDSSGVSVLKDRRDEGRLRTVVYAGGIGQSFLPYGGEHTFLGAFGVLLHPDPLDVAIVGLGSGDTLYGAAARRETERLDCIEIVASQLETLRRLAQTHAYAGLTALLADPRVRHVAGDGRAFLMRSRRRYDVIEADALRPTSAFAGSLYSLEYFELLRERLKPGGLAVSWGPSPRIRLTFRQVFPHVLLLSQVLVGSDRPIPFTPALLRARLAEPFSREHFAQGQIDAAQLFERFVDEPPAVFGPRGRAAVEPVDLNTDLFPRDEYLVPRPR